MTGPAFAVVQDPAPPLRRFALLTADELAQRPPLSWMVKGVLPSRGVAAIYGPAGSGKTFLATDLAAAVAAGESWFGRRVKRCPATYVALEGEAGIATRIAARRMACGSIPEGMRFALEEFSFFDLRDVPGLAASIKEAGGEGGLTVVDTLARASAGADENSGADMGHIIAKASELQRLTGGVVLLVHHAGKNAAQGLRGHSSLMGALDAAIEVTREGTHREWKVAKSKDGRDGEAHAFRLEVIELGEDEDGDAITSCIVRPDDLPADQIRRALPPAGGNKRIAFDAISSALKDARAYGKASAPPTRPCIELERAIEAASAALPVEPKRRRERAQSAVQALVANGNLMHAEGWVWLS